VSWKKTWLGFTGVATIYLFYNTFERVVDAAQPPGLLITAVKKAAS
jgi:hypothetical protein